jgi:signal peptidase I
MNVNNISNKNNPKPNINYTNRPGFPRSVQSPNTTQPYSQPGPINNNNPNQAANNYNSQVLNTYLNQQSNTTGLNASGAGSVKKVVKSSVAGLLLFIGEIIVTIILAIAITFGIKQFLIQPFMVEGVSMEPNFHNNEYLIINEIGYRLDKPKRTDVIVFKYPLNESKYYIKRVIGLPTETVKIKGGQVSVCQKNNKNCQVLDEKSYLPADTATDGDTNLTLKDDEYFVLGDHRNQSSDSRYWGVLKKDEIVGKVWIKVLPTQEFKIY